MRHTVRSRRWVITQRSTALLVALGLFGCSMNEKALENEPPAVTDEPPLSSAEPQQQGEETAPSARLPGVRTADHPRPSPGIAVGTPDAPAPALDPSVREAPLVPLDPSDIEAVIAHHPEVQVHLADHPSQQALLAERIPTALALASAPTAFFIATGDRLAVPVSEVFAVRTHLVFKLADGTLAAQTVTVSGPGAAFFGSPDSGLIFGMLTPTGNGEVSLTDLASAVFVANNVINSAWWAYWQGYAEVLTSLPVGDLILGNLGFAKRVSPSACRTPQRLAAPASGSTNRSPCASTSSGSWTTASANPCCTGCGDGSLLPRTMRGGLATSRLLVDRLVVSSPCAQTHPAGGLPQPCDG